MFKVEFSGFKTREQAQAFVDWYSGAGEQDAATWFECRVDEGELDANFMPTKGGPDWEGDTLKQRLDIFCGEEE